MRVEIRLRLGVDHRADIGRGVGGIAERQFGRRAGDHLEHRLGDVVLQAEEAERRAALAGGAEGRGRRRRR